MAKPIKLRHDMTGDCWERIQAVFHDVFGDASIVVDSETKAQDIDGWDSLANIRLIVAVEREFKVRFSPVEISRLANVGQLMMLVDSKLK
jgi:acyl carrier protein